MAKAANRYKNQAILEVDGEEYILHPTFDAIAKVESQISTGSIEALVYDAARQRIKVADAVIIIREFSKAGGNEIEDEALQTYFEENGTKWIFLQLSQEVLPRVLYGGKGYEKYFAKHAREILESIGIDEDEDSPEDIDDAKKKSQEQTLNNSSQPQ